MKHIALSLIIMAGLLSLIQAVTLNVPADYSTIQAGINASQNGDLVLVAPGTYYENINFRGKNITLSSNYINDHNPNTILSTIINGSNSAEADTGSVVLIISGEDSTAVLNGFTITGGTGTKWHYEHGGSILRAGGGIFSTLSSPTISNNLIINNEAILVYDNILTAGGGGIRVGDGTPKIINNVIANNRGMYCGGLDLNYTGAIIKNNIIANNKVYQAVPYTTTYGAGGFCAYMNYQGNPVIVENNTIVGNEATGEYSNAAGRAGGLMGWTTNMILRNNIIQANNQSYGGGIHNIGSNMDISYCALDEMWPGEGNTTALAQFTGSSLLLSPESPCIDAGNPNPVYNDLENPAQPGFALLPSQLTLRNDVGAYGGPLAIYLAVADLNAWFCPSALFLQSAGINQNNYFKVPITNQSNNSWQIISIETSNPQLYYNSAIPELLIPPMQRDSLQFVLNPNIPGNQEDVIYIHHNNPNVTSPIEVTVVYTVGNADLTHENKPILNNYTIYPNPFNPQTNISYSLQADAHVKVEIFNIKGQLVSVLLDRDQKQGKQRVMWSGYDRQNKQVASGVYYCRIECGSMVQSRKLLLLK